VKKSSVVTTLIVFAVGALALGALAAEPQTITEPPIAQVRIVNMSALAGVSYDDKELMALANLDVSKNTNIFPIVSDFSIVEGGKEYKPGKEIPCQVTCPINISSAISESEKLEFTSISDSAGKYNIAVVGKDGAVKRLDETADIDYSLKVLKTAKPIPLAQGDTLLVFVKNVPETYFDYQGLEKSQGFVPY
jgi:hypothetical protein